MNLVKNIFCSILIIISLQPLAANSPQVSPEDILPEFNQHLPNNAPNFDNPSARYSLGFIALTLGSGLLGASYYCGTSCLESSSTGGAIGFGIGSAITGLAGLGITGIGLIVPSPLGRTMLETVNEMEYQEKIAAHHEKAHAWQIYIDGQEKQRKEETIKRKMIDKFRRMQERLYKEFSH